jgi:hypothetical protein
VHGLVSSWRANFSLSSASRQERNFSSRRGISAQGEEFQLKERKFSSRRGISAQERNFSSGEEFQLEERNFSSGEEFFQVFGIIL